MSLCLSRVRVDLDALRHNFSFIKAHSGKPLMPVIKADAYGHGLLECARVLRENGADHIAVGSVAEAVSLRQDGYPGEIIALLGAVWDADVAALGEHRIVPLVHDWAGLRRLADTGKALSVAIKCNTGMARLGFDAADIPAVVEFLKAASLVPSYVVTHMAAADVPDEDAFTMLQVKRFEGAVAALRSAFPNIVASLGNSATLLSFPHLAGDLGRPGVVLYGGNPLHGTSREHLGASLRMVMEVSTPVVSVHPLRKGDSLGYGRTFVAPRDMTVAVAGIGYADAYRRNPPSDGVCMTLGGRRAPIIGRVAMQMTCLDVTDLPPVRVGDMAYVLGGEGNAVTLQELATWWKTIPYEVTCLLGKDRII